MAPKRKPPKAPIYVIDAEFQDMDTNNLKASLQTFRERFNEMKSKRNYIQMDRDMVQGFYENTMKEIDDLKMQITNKETEAEKHEYEHQMDIKVYIHKVKQLEYEQEKTNKDIENDGEGAKQLETDNFNQRLTDMTKDKVKLKTNYTEQEKQNIGNVNKIEEKNQKVYETYEKEFNTKLKDLIAKYESRLMKLREELELKLKVEIHELEERKNLHINELINNHEKAFAELKKYYNDITAENLSLIKSQKEAIAKINADLNTNTKLINKMKAENAALKEPLEEKTKQRNDLKNHLKQFEKHKMSLSNLKCKLIVLKEKIAKLKSDSEELNLKYDKSDKEKKELESKFEKITNEVKQHADIQNIVLIHRLQGLQETLEAKETQLNLLLEKGHLDTKLYEDLKAKIQISIEQKNTLIKNLKYSIHHATKAYNDAIRVYEAKLVEFGVPREELGFQPLETITSIMPAGLVSS